MPSRNGAGTGFTSLNDYLNANQDTLSNESKTLSNNAENAADSAQAQAHGVGQNAIKAGMTGTTDPTQVAGYGAAQTALANAQTGLNGLTNFGGVSDALQQQYGKDYNDGARNFDASLLGGSADAQGNFKAAQGQYSDLGSYLDGQAKAGLSQGQAQAAPAPSSGTPTPKSYNPPEQYNGADPTQNRGGSRGQYGGPPRTPAAPSAPTPRPNTPFGTPGKTSDDPNPKKKNDPWGDS